MAQDWDIKPRGNACQACQKEFENGETYNSALMLGAEGYGRADYCATCWIANQHQSKPYSAWKAKYKVPPAKSEAPLKKETAETLLRKLMETEDPAQRNVIFILAVMLERSRIMLERDVQKREDGVTIRIYEHRKTGETFVIPDPHLRLDQLTQVQQEVVTLLGGGGEKPPAPAPEAEPPSA